MWQRFRRAMRSVRRASSSRSIEDPELILEQNIRDLNDQVPKMNESIAMVRANVTLLEKENAKYKTEVARPHRQGEGRHPGAAATTSPPSTPRRLQIEKGGAGAQRGAARHRAASAYEKALTVKKVFMREKDRKTQEAMQAIRDARRAKWQSKVADAMESFEVAGIDATHDEMVRKVEEQTAVNEARMQMALESVDHQAVQIEEDAEKLRAAGAGQAVQGGDGPRRAPPPVSDVGEAARRPSARRSRSSRQASWPFGAAAASSSS